jgi:multisite-specific tRNA:(cytosine-C5)-methyltransferase
MILQTKTLSKNQNQNWAPQLHHSRESTMGGRGKSRTQRKHFRQNRENVWKRSKPDPDPSLSSDKSQTTHWTPFSTENPSFDSYYKQQLIVDPQEWDQFVAILRTPLPASFRINARFIHVHF